MSMKLVVGGSAFVILGLLAGAVTPLTRQTATTPSNDPPYVQAFVRECHSAIRDRNALKICRCMATNLDGTLLSNDEYGLAGDIVTAISQSGTNRSRMQSRFNDLSQRYHGRVSLDRKAAVLKAVSREGVSCGKHHS